jgi:putative tryptophan/tyrosine transport system substrate-binding protein
MRTRRELITLLGGAAAWPLTARAQQPAMPVIGFLGTTFPTERPERLVALRQGLGEVGFVEGKTIAIEYRWAEDRPDRLPELALELVRRQVAVIAVAGNAPAILAAKSATTTIPIVFSVPGDPVKLGLVSSINRPGGNATGINFFVGELGTKRVGLLHELLPGATRLAVLVNPSDKTTMEVTTRDVQEAARTMGLQVHVVYAATGPDIDQAFATLGREQSDALFVGPDIFFNSRRVQIAILAARYGIPSAFAVRDYVEAGGLMSYGTNINDAYRQVGVYTGRILKGEKPADLPVLQATRFELVINLRTARALGVSVPPSLLARADEVIE